MTPPITMRELHRMSAHSIESLPHPVRIQNGNETVGYLVPARNARTILVEEAVRLVEKARASRTPEQEAAITEALREIGAE